VATTRGQVDGTNDPRKDARGAADARDGNPCRNYIDAFRSRARPKPQSWFGGIRQLSAAAVAPGARYRLRQPRRGGRQSLARVCQSSSEVLCVGTRAACSLSNPSILLTGASDSLHFKLKTVMYLDDLPAALESRAAASVAGC